MNYYFILFFLDVLLAEIFYKFYLFKKNLLLFKKHGIKIIILTYSNSHTRNIFMELSLINIQKNNNNIKKDISSKLIDKKKNPDLLLNRKCKEYKTANKKQQKQINNNISIIPAYVLKIIAIIEQKTGISIDRNRLLGTGGFGYVFKGEYRKIPYAIKISSNNIRKPIEEDKLDKLLNNELVMTSNMKNKYCIKAFGSYNLGKTFKVLILAYMSNSDLGFLCSLIFNKTLFPNLIFFNEEKIDRQLENMIKSQEKSSKRDCAINYSQLKKCNEFRASEKYLNAYGYLAEPSESLIYFFAIQIFYGLEYLNKFNIIHLDLKKENILIGRSLDAKISDFFLSRQIEEKSEFFQLTNIGSKYSMGPEYFLKDKCIPNKFAARVDLYSFGNILLNFLTNGYLGFKSGQPLTYETLKEAYQINFEGENCYENFLKNFNLKRKISNEFFNLLSRLLHYDIAKRSDYMETKNHPWLNNKQKASSIRYYYEVNENDFIKFIYELQKFDECDFYIKRFNEDEFYSISEQEFEITEEFLF